jgi:hypothetical protein
MPPAGAGLAGAGLAGAGLAFCVAAGEADAAGALEDARTGLGAATGATEEATTETGTGTGTGTTEETTGPATAPGADGVGVTVAEDGSGAAKDTTGVVPDG